MEEVSSSPLLLKKQKVSSKVARTINDLRKTFGSSKSITIADFKALIGAPEPKVRVNGLGVRGLRWTVEAVDEKTGKVSIAAASSTGEKIPDVVDYRDLSIVTTDKAESRLKGRF